MVRNGLLANCLATAGDRLHRVDLKKLTERIVQYRIFRVHGLRFFKKPCGKIEKNGAGIDLTLRLGEAALSNRRQFRNRLAEGQHRHRATGVVGEFVGVIHAEMLVHLSLIHI